MQHDFETKLDTWANKAADICHEIATSNDPKIRVDKFFYAFQSEPKENPELLIVALNPGGNGNYIEGCRNEKRNIQRVSKNEMKHKNLWWDKSDFSEGHEEWKIWKNLKITFGSDKLKPILENCVYMNQIYFNTIDFAELTNTEGGRNTIKICQELTMEVIFDIIKPKNILCLGVSDCFNGLKDGQNYSVLKINPKNKKLEFIPISYFHYKLI